MFSAFQAACEEHPESLNIPLSRDFPEPLNIPLSRARSVPEEVLGKQMRDSSSEPNFRSVGNCEQSADEAPASTPKNGIRTPSDWGTPMSQTDQDQDRNCWGSLFGTDSSRAADWPAAGVFPEFPSSAWNTNNVAGTA